MSKFLISLILAILPFHGSLKQVQKPYPIKSGMIKYKIEGRTNGSELIYFDNYGELIYIEKSYKESNLKTNSDIKILCCDTLITFNNKNLTAHKKFIDRKTQSIENNIVTPKILHSLEYLLTGTETISKIKCDKYEGDNGKIWIWKNLIFKTELFVLNTLIKKEVVEFIQEPEIATNKFNIPENYTIIYNP